MSELERICHEIQEEARAILEYTADIDSGVLAADAVNVFKDVRLDELEHLQAHVILLTKRLKGEEHGKTA
jgi:hypothetical protein